MSGFDIAPEPDAEGLTANLQGLDAQGQPISLPVVQERPLTIYLNRQEIITAMTLGDRPKEMAVGFLFNQNMLKRGDVIIGIASSGPHSNGYSLIRKIIDISGVDLASSCGSTTLADALMAPTQIYNKPLLALQREIKPHALAHITGGGLLENIPRVLPEGCPAVLDKTSWDMPPVFTWLAEAGGVAEEEMHRTFNCGVGMTVIVGPAKAEAAIQLLSDHGLNCWELGRIEAGDGSVVFSS